MSVFKQRNGSFQGAFHRLNLIAVSESLYCEEAKRVTTNIIAFQHAAHILFKQS